MRGEELRRDIAALVGVVTRSVMGTAPEGMKKGDVGALALVPEFVLVAVVVWFGVALPQPVLAGVEEATAIVLQQDSDVLHEAPLFKDLFAATEGARDAASE